MAATPAVTKPDTAVSPPNDAGDDAKRQEKTLKERLETNRSMVQKYHAMFPKIPTMTSEELIARWNEIDRIRDEYDDSQNSLDGDESYTKPSSSLSPSASAETEDALSGPILLIDVRSKAEREVSMIPGALSMNDLETTRWINKYVHLFDGPLKKGTGIPTIVTYCTIGYRSGREAQWLVDELTGTFGIEIGKSVEIKNLDGILSYSFVKDAPPLLSPCRKGSSDTLITRRIHSYGKEWSEAADPSFEIVCFDSSKVQKAKHLLQTGLASAFRMVQHQVVKTTTKAKKVTRTSVLVEPMDLPRSLTGSKDDSSTGSNEGRLHKSKRITAMGFTSNESAESPAETDVH